MESGLQTIVTIGHSTRSLEDLVRLLKENGVTMVADIRTVPRSRHNPRFNKETLPDDLGAAGVRVIEDKVVYPAQSQREAES